MKTTYDTLHSPLAQLDAVHDFLQQMLSRVHDTWIDTNDPRGEDDSSEEFLSKLEDEGFDRDVILACQALDLRFEFDGEEEGEGHFHLKSKGWPKDNVLQVFASAFNKKVCEFAPKGWELKDTEMCLGWENLVLVPDTSKSMAMALKLLDD
jgi:hypothetical protein